MSTTASPPSLHPADTANLLLAAINQHAKAVVSYEQAQIIQSLTAAYTNLVLATDQVSR